MDNFNDTSNSWSDDLQIDCNDLTNNGLYVLFVGYVLPLLSPRVRNYGREVFSMIKNAGKVASNVVSLTEYGFEKIQDLTNNGEMVDFIQRVCDKHGFNVLSGEITKLAWKFSGDTNNGKKEGLQQTWKKLIDELKKLDNMNTMDKTRRA